MALRRTSSRPRARALGAGVLVVLACLLALVTARRLGRGERPAEAGPPPAMPWLERRDGQRGGTGAIPPPPSTGWEEAAETVALDLASVLEGHPRTGAYAEATVEAARRDLARFPPDAARVRRLLLGTARERCWALVAVAALPEVDDDLAGLVLRSLRPEDDDLQRLLTAQAVAALPPALLSRHEAELVAAFEGETNPLVLMEALPALERMEPESLQSFLEHQLELASPEMLPFLVALARDRLAPSALEEVGILVSPGPRGR